MAMVTFMNGSDYSIRLSRLLNDSSRISKEAIFAGANLIADEIKKNLIENIQDPESVALNSDAFGAKDSKSTGSLVESFGISPIEQDASGNWNAKIGFDGYDSKGIPNQLKARAMESGTSQLKKRPFVRPAVNSTKRRAADKMADVVEREIKKLKL